MDYDGPPPMPEPMPEPMPVREPWLDPDDGEGPDDDLDLTPEEDRAQNDVDVRIETKDGRVTVAFTVDAVNLPILEQFIAVDVLEKIADAVRDEEGQ